MLLLTNVSQNDIIKEPQFLQRSCKRELSDVIDEDGCRPVTHPAESIPALERTGQADPSSGAAGHHPGTTDRTITMSEADDRGERGSLVIRTQVQGDTDRGAETEQ